MGDLNVIVRDIVRDGVTCTYTMPGVNERSEYLVNVCKGY